MEDNEREPLFDELIKEHLKPVYNFIYRLMRNREDAEDVTQETFFKVWKNIKKYDRNENPEAWIFTIARNTAIDYLRKKKTLVFSELSAGNDGEEPFEESIADISPLPDEIFARAEKNKMLEDLLGKLSPAYREVLLLRYQNDLTLEEIGRILKKPLNTIKSQHRRGLAFLKNLIKNAPK